MDQRRFSIGLLERLAGQPLYRLAAALVLIQFGGEAITDFATGVAVAIYEELPRK